MLRIQDSLLKELLQFCSLENDCVFLDTSLPDDENRLSLLFVKPVERLVCREGDDLEVYLGLLQKALDSGHHLAGWVGYEFGSMLEGRYVRDTSSFSEPPVILADFGVFLKPYKFNHHTGKNNFPSHFQGESTAKDENYTIKNLSPNMEQDEFVEAIEAVKALIEAGDTYQVNYTMKLLFDFEGSVEALYQSLRRNQSVSYGAYIKNGGEHILSFSPELFFRKTSGEITVRPMKGTSVRGDNLDEEQQYKDTLHYDGKNRAENVMIVDLLRNDLSRLLFNENEATVTTTSLFDVESYESLLQMTSTVKGVCSKNRIQNIPLSRLFHSLFPCGSITGAPKIRTMQIIEELEKEPRGVYTGAIGYIAPGGDAVFNVPIRTIRLAGKKGEMGIGAGITHGSVPAEEWHESLLKGRFLTHLQLPFQLFETMLWQKESSFYLLEEHLARLARGAEYFKFSFDPLLIRQQLATHASSFTAEALRVRLVLEKDGQISITATECDRPLFIRLPAAKDLGARPISGSVRCVTTSTADLGPYIYYKSSRRAMYDSEFKKVLERGETDALFFNDQNELTEGCISNVIVLKDGCYFTPPVQCGLLPGVMREQLLLQGEDSPMVKEKVLLKEDIENCDAVFICNSVRGVVRVNVLT
ncbi:chorismate-binding protein [Desulforhopalus sp. 52FAK]